MTDMDTKKQPGIKFNFVILSKSVFERKKSIHSKNDISIKYSCNNAITPNNQILETELTAEITEKNENFKLLCSMVGVFTLENENENLNLKDFAEMNAAALIFPYVREHITNITSKAGLQPVILPPTNIMAMVQENK